MPKAKTGLNLEDFQFANDEARKAFEVAIDSLSKWRDEIADTTERNADKVFDAMSEAATALGWPEQFVDGLRRQMEETTGVQTKFMDTVVDAWMQQIRNPGPPFPALQGWPSQMATFQSPFFGSNAPGFGAMGFDPDTMMASPMQFWTQATKFWQDAWMQALNGMTDMQKSATTKMSDVGRRRS